MGVVMLSFDFSTVTKEFFIDETRLHPTGTIGTYNRDYLHKHLDQYINRWLETGSGRPGRDYVPYI